MKQGIIALVTVATLLGSAKVSKSATAIFEMNGVNWGTNYYNPDVIDDPTLYDKLPTQTGQTSPLWSVNAVSAGSTVSVISNYLEISTSGAQTASYKNSAGFDPTLTGNLTIETRLRVVSLASGATRAGTFVLNLGGNWIDFNISGTSIGTSAQPSLLTGLDLSQWTTIRFTISSATSSPTLSIYLNNNTSPAITTTQFNTGSTATNIIFGDPSVSTATGGTMDWDYIAWSSSGAFAPIPEPKSQALLGLAGMVAAFASVSILRAKRSRS